MKPKHSINIDELKENIGFILLIVAALEKTKGTTATDEAPAPKPNIEK